MFETKIHSDKTRSGRSAAGSLFIQPKLTINEPNDVYEKEADNVADKVMRMSAPSSQKLFFPPAIVQRKCESCKEEEKAQRKEDDAQTLEAPPRAESYLNSLSGGRSLSTEERNFYEPRIGYDFSDVRLHTDEAANRSAKELNALAYTQGNNIVFSNSQYEPDTQTGKKLMAHELTHVVQQRSGINNLQPKLIQRADVTTNQTHTVSDAPYGWTSAYQIVKSDTEVTINLSVQLVPDSGVSAAQVTTIQNQTRNEFLRYWDNRFSLTDSAGTARVLRVNLNFAASGANQTIQVHAGGGRDDLSNWFVQGSSITRAHELGHALGLKDEYVDASAASRATATASGVFTDHSIMGNYFTEGIGSADVRLRHGQQLATDISTATGETFTAGWSSTYIVRAGDTLSSIARRIYGDAAKWRDIYNLNKSTIPNPNVLRLGQVLTLPPR